MDTIKLLLVEDDPSLRYIVQSGLEDIIEGYEAVSYTHLMYEILRNVVFDKRGGGDFGGGPTIRPPKFSFPIK